MWIFTILLAVFPGCFLALESAPPPHVIYDEQTILPDLPQLEPNDDAPVATVNAFQELELMAGNILIGERGKASTIFVTEESIVRLDNVTFADKPNPVPGALPCRTVAKDQADYLCQNYITVIQPIANGKVIVCGTNGLVPLCYSCTYDDTNYLECDENDASKFYFIEDNGLVAHEPVQDIAWLYIKNTDGTEVVFTGANEDRGQKSVMSRVEIDGDGKLDLSTVIKTDKDDPDWLNNAEFVGNPIDYGDHIYYFFRETATEYINAGKIVYSRVGRICKNDDGGAIGTSLDGKWTTFQKARLNCSTQGDFPFYFNELQDIYPAQADGSADIIYATFSTPQTGATGSAVCVFRLDEIKELFEMGSFKGAATVSELWLPVDDKDVPANRPGSCGTPHPGTDYPFIKNFPLMDPLVPNTRGYDTKKIYDHTSNSPLAIIQGVRIVELVVDEGVQDAQGNLHDVFFLASDNSSVYKMYMPNANDAVLIEEYNLQLDQDKQEKIITMKLYNETLLIGTTESVISVPVQHCATYETYCYRCVQAQDPYCSWIGDACKAEESGGKQCLRETRSQTPYSCPNQCDDWPKPKIAFVSDKDAYVTAKEKPINLYFSATAPRYSNLMYSFTCQCDNGADCSGQFDDGVKYQRLSSVEWVSVALQAATWDPNCKANVTHTVTANAVTETSVSRIEVDTTGLVQDSYADEITDYDNLISAHLHEVSEWEENAIEACYKDDVKTCSPSN